MLQHLGCPKTQPLTSKWFSHIPINWWQAGVSWIIHKDKQMWTTFNTYLKNITVANNNGYHLSQLNIMILSKSHVSCHPYASVFSFNICFQAERVPRQFRGVVLPSLRFVKDLSDLAGCFCSQTLNTSKKIPQTGHPNFLAPSTHNRNQHCKVLNNTTSVASVLAPRFGEMNPRWIRHSENLSAAHGFFSQKGSDLTELMSWWFMIHRYLYD